MGDTRLMRQKVFGVRLAFVFIIKTKFKASKISDDNRYANVMKELSIPEKVMWLHADTAKKEYRRE